jgi:alanyl-tRNA synthetase
VTQGELNCGVSGKLMFDVNHRLGCMRHHTATHLLNAALHQHIGDTCQRSSHVTPTDLAFDFAAYSPLESHQLEAMQQFVRDQIKAALPVVRKDMPISQLPATAIKVGLIFAHNLIVLLQGVTVCA